jgi:hypothetical protein
MDEVVTLTNKSVDKLILTLVEVGPGIEVEMPESIGADGSVELHVRRTDVDSGSRLETSFTVEATGNSGPKQRVSIPVVYGDFSFRPEFTTTRR